MTSRSPSDAARAIDGYVPFPDEAVAAYVDAGHWPNRTLHEVLDGTAAQRPDRVAATDPDRTLTYAELAANSRAVAAFLAGDLGLARHDRVALQLSNRVSFLELLFGCSRVGVLPVMLLPRHREKEVRHVLDAMDARAYVTVAGGPEARFDHVGLVDGLCDSVPSLDHRLAVTPGGRDLPGGWTRFESVVAGPVGDPAREAVESTAVDPNDPALVLLSGGTTGVPKGIPRTHNDYAFQWERLADVWGVEPDWTGFPSVPIGHNASLVCVVGPAVHVGASVAMDPVLKPERLLALIERERGSFSLPIPTQLVDILEHPEREAYDLSSLELLISGGQKVPPRVVRAFVERYDVGFGNIFGMAEGPIITTRPDDPVEVQAETVGRPLAPDADEVRLVDPDDRSQAVEAGEIGELAMRGPGVFRGYFREPAENEANFDDEGWFYTEDLLARRPDGNYEVHGRLSETVIRGGETIHTPGLESELVDHPAVENVAVVGKPDDRLGERPYAFVKPASGADPPTVEELGSFLADRGVAVFKRPEFVSVVDEFPRTSVQKIDKAALERRLEE